MLNEIPSNEFIRMLASPDQKRAIDELERRGFVYGLHFGTDNAKMRLAEIDIAMRDGTLYEYLGARYGEFL